VSGDETHTPAGRPRTPRKLSLQVSASAIGGFLVLTFLFVQSVEQPTANEILKAAGLSLLLYITIVLHECGHAAVALTMGLAPVSMRIHALGGSTSYLRMRPSPGREALIAAAGPAVTAVLAVIMRILQNATDPSGYSVFGFMYSACVVLTVFNLLPGLPLDGGAIVKSLAWALTKDERRATRFAAGTGMVLAVGLVAFGAWAYSRSHDRMWILLSGVLALTIGFGAYRIWQYYSPMDEAPRPDVFNARIMLAQQPPEAEPEQGPHGSTPPNH
jgi:Zn-dependent protease